MRKKQQQQAPRMIDAPLYSHWQALYMALYSRRLYVDVAKRWTGIGLLYILLLQAIIMIPFAIRTMIEFNHFFNNTILLPIERIPLFYISNGEVLFDKKMPYLIKNNEGQVVSIIDTTGRVSNIDDTYPDLKFLVTKNKLYMRPTLMGVHDKITVDMSKRNLIVQDFGNNANFIFNPMTWIENMHFKWIKIGVLVLIYPVIVSFSFGMIYSLMMVFAMLSQAYAWLILKTKLTFPQAARLLTVASTAPLAIFMVCLAFGAIFAGLGLLCIGLWSIYFSLGTLSFKRENRSLVHA